MAAISSGDPVNENLEMVTTSMDMDMDMAGGAPSSTGLIMSLLLISRPDKTRRTSGTRTHLWMDVAQIGTSCQTFKDEMMIDNNETGLRFKQKCNTKCSILPFSQNGFW